MKAQLILENGKRFEGKMFGCIKNIAGEVIFTTGMVGYQQIVTDPAYAGQIVVMTFPLIGNYGINLEDSEEGNATANAIIVREKCDYPSNFRNEMNLDDFLSEQGVVGLEGIDTRALTQEIRNCGIMKGVIMLGEPDENLTKAMMDELDNTNIVAQTTVDNAYTVNENGSTDVAVIDMGAKGSIVKDLQKKGCRITVFPANAKAEEIEKINPAFVFVSNGAGNPENACETVETVKSLITKYPVCGVSMGHQIIALALGCKVQKLKFGHHGSNQPVKENATGRVHITTQNHNYIVSDVSGDVEITFTNVNDGTCAGIRHKELPVQSIQFMPGDAPLDMGYLFDRFLKEVR